MNQRAFIEDWLPIGEIGVESRRENSTGQHPPPNRLHVWWARRPLTASRAAVLGSVLPAWSEDWPEHLLSLFPIAKDYREWFIHLLGIRGDPVAAYQRILDAKEKGIRLKKSYDGPRAFTLGPDAEEIETLRQLLSYRWGTETPTVLDPTAGGGSIPFEAVRFGLVAKANELNPVASFVLEGTLSLPARFGPELAEDIAKWGRVWASRVEQRLDPYFPRQPGDSIHAYLFARTVACPETGKSVPLSPNWWLQKGSKKVAAELITDPEMDQCRFRIVEGDDIDFDPNEGTVNRGKGRSPWTGNVISGDYIKAEAQAGRMGAQLYAVAIKKGRQLEFRLPDQSDLEALTAAEVESERLKQNWQTDDILPFEDIPFGSKTSEAIRYGMTTWDHMFSPRQLLVMGTTVEELRRIEEDIRQEMESDHADAVLSYLAIAFDKLTNFNAILCRWQAGRTQIVGFFDRHDFSFKWSFTEWDGAHNLLHWGVAQVVSAYKGITKLIEPSRQVLFPSHPERASQLVEVKRGDATDLPIESGSVHAVVMDPPYYDNVQYAELSDFFYVWLKRTAGHLYPQFFRTELTDKAAEAVANPARFVEFDKKNSKKLAHQDYQAKMTNIFAEIHRVLRDDGVLTVMFNHKKTEAWDALGRSLIDGGFEVQTTWPVHTESQHALHQAKKAAAASTILLTCRKRPKTQDSESVWWEDLQDEIRELTRQKAEQYSAYGVEGVDLYIATFGPVLSVISRQWPVLTQEVDPETGQARQLRPEQALDLARQEVGRLRLQGLSQGHPVEFDPVTRWYLLAWDTFPAVEFPYDEARKLALAAGIDLDKDVRSVNLVFKKSGSVVFQEPKARRHNYADPESDHFERLIDSAHALMNAFHEDGIKGAEAFLKRTRLNNDPPFRSLLQALLNAIPRTKKDGWFIRPEARALDALTLLFPELEVPKDPRVISEPVQEEIDWVPEGD
ncbi:MAG: DUF1156 domain-containing protein [bacterium]|nr:DUF1156 domain-containing protein [bacterium]